MRKLFCDPALIRELAEPGSDTRCGVNLVCRPPRNVTSLILELQNQLRAVEPDQYYYPSADLHLTLFEICHSLDSKEAANIAETIASEPGVWLKCVRPLALRAPVPVFDERGGVLRFEALSPFVAMHGSLAGSISQLEIPLMRRYSSVSPHITFMRYTRLLTTDAEEWTQLLRRLAVQLPLTWVLDEVWLTWGGTWFGMRSRINERGPYRLYREQHS